MLGTLWAKDEINVPIALSAFRDKRDTVCHRTEVGLGPSAALSHSMHSGVGITAAEGR